LIIGIFISPKTAKIDEKYAELLLDFKVIYVKYIKNKIRLEVSLASQTQKAPHAGLPHIEPVINVIKQKIAPIGARASAIKS
jgi:hypothetical protein